MECCGRSVTSLWVLGTGMGCVVCSDTQSSGRSEWWISATYLRSAVVVAGRCVAAQVCYVEAPWPCLEQWQSGIFPVAEP